MTTNDTRTDEQRVEAWRRDEHLAAEAERQTPFNGWENAMENAALQQKFIDGANWQAARDAEPTTMSAEQIKALKALADKFQYSAWIDVTVGDLHTKTRNANAMSAWLRAYIAEQEQTNG